MEYTVQKLARIAGVSARTLRYYDEIGMLKPARINASGYRIYGQQQVDMLQQIMFYRELGMSLEQIRDVISAPAFDRRQALLDHRQQLLDRQKQLDALLANVNKSIAAEEGSIHMRDQEKFEGFKRQLIADNERQYGEEVREKYGEEQVDQANEQFRNMTAKQYEEATRLEHAIKQTLSEAFQQGDPGGEQAQQAADLHRQWITMYWGTYSAESHAGLAQMYVEDERFTVYYDAEQPGTAAFLKKAIDIYTGTRS
ncbi:MerR family transcriptional regulator [Marinicrinis sediminis]|uniref:MerR family transcriptional regulator n=1 Tax=Marinicrinis sediminis TaxID=1652465 RepID=A0ABW5R9K0_9BACL